jgi:hypothetical protein
MIQLHVSFLTTQTILTKYDRIGVFGTSLLWSLAEQDYEAHTLSLGLRVTKSNDMYPA